MAETSYLSEFDGATTDDILTYAKNGKTGQVNEKVANYEQSGVKDYVDQMKGQTTVSDADTVQVFDTNGVPHKIAKTELLKKSAQALPTISDISAFIALNKAGNAIGLMSIEETAKVVGELNGFMALGKYTNKSLNDLTYGFVKAENCSNGPEGTFTGIVRTYSPDNYVIAQVAIDTSGDMSIRVNWDGWRGWRKYY